jgi:hypothetical protein
MILKHKRSDKGFKKFRAQDPQNGKDCHEKTYYQSKEASTAQ